MTQVPQIRRVAVLGSSISMLVRPKGIGLPYPRALERLLNQDAIDLWVVENLSRIAATIEDVAVYLPRLVADQPDVIVFHYGHVEAVQRPQTRSAWYRLHDVGPGAPPRRRHLAIVRAKYAGLRRRLRLRQQWTPLKRFQRVFRETLEYLAAETRATCIVIEANPGDEKVENWGPGSLAAIQRYNQAMCEIAAAGGAIWIPFDRAIRPEAIAYFIPDGTHFTAEGHLALASVLAKEIMATTSLAESR